VRVPDRGGIRHRGRVLRLAAAGIALVAPLSGCGGPTGPEKALVLVTIDTCRADRIGCYGAENALTPAMDALAARGARFDQAQAPVPLTLPSHCTILTGLYPDRHGVRDNGPARLPDEAVTIAEILREAGWATGAFVSAYPVDSEFGTDQGFDRYDDEVVASSAGRLAYGSEDAVNAADRFFYDERTAPATLEAARPWLEEAVRGDRPFFAWFHFFDPHAVYDPPERFLRGTGLDAYSGEIAHVDEQIANLLEALDGLEDRTIVAVTADHGEALGEHEEMSHGLFVYQGTLRVPWILAGPGVPAGRRVEPPVSLAAVLPTLLELVDVPAPEGLDAESVVPLLHEGEEEVEVGPVFAEALYARIHYDWAGLRAVRDGRWKLIEAPTPELYDLEVDPDETTDLAGSRPEVVADLRATLSRWSSRGGRLGSETAVADETMRSRLEALGYVGGSEVDAAELDADLWNPDGHDPKDMVDVFNRLQEVPTLTMSGRLDEAGDLLAELRAEDPGNESILERLAYVRRTQERWEEARDLCREQLERDPDDASVRRNLAHTYLELGEPDAAREQYLLVLDRDPDSARTWGLLASLEEDAGRLDEAIRAAGRAAELEPDTAPRHTELARLHEAADETSEALVAYDRALAIDPALSAAVNGKALLLAHAGRPREAVATLRAGLPALAQDLDTLNNLAWILANESIDPPEGLEIARRAAALAPDDPVVLDTLGWAAIRSGKPAEAIGPLERAWRATGDAEVQAHLGVALAESGRESEGAAHVRAAVSERPALAEIPEIARWNRAR
jgi:arylsulfatase A-like enzyme/predicted Zn-dependent protease